MDNYTIGCDAHKHYSVFAVLDREGVLNIQLDAMLTNTIRYLQFWIEKEY